MATKLKAKSNAGSKSPVKLSIRSYQVGFGDCFLLSFHYPAAGSGKAEERHVLIDCGSTGKPKKGPTLKEVADQVAVDCGGKLTAVVATHRHADHISGFATNTKGNAPGDVIRGLKPDLVMQPWTEHPDLPKNAKSLPAKLKTSGNALFGASTVAMSLDSMHQVAASVLREVGHNGRALSKSMRSQLAFLGEENLKNLPAVKNLITMGKKGCAEYLSYGDKTRLSRLLPGVKVHVLGPPTPKQYPDVARQRSKDAGEFWNLMGFSTERLAGSAAPFAASKAYSRKSQPRETRWLIDRVRALHGAQRLALVRALDDAMNNTSLILLLEVGEKKFLFPGDAQIENWRYALQDSPEAAANRKLLAGTDFYKVGHHGSLNATPKSLWNLFAKRGGKTKPGRLRSAVSTMLGKHGSTAAKTEVPRRTLVDALKAETHFVTTQDLKSKREKAHLIEFDLE